jgi:hypothetical protein
MLPNPNRLSCPHLFIISFISLSNISCAGVAIVLGQGVEEEAFCGSGKQKHCQKRRRARLSAEMGCGALAHKQ